MMVDFKNYLILIHPHCVIFIMRIWLIFFLLRMSFPKTSLVSHQWSRYNKQKIKQEIRKKQSHMSALIVSYLNRKKKYADRIKSYFLMFISLAFLSTNFKQISLLISICYNIRQNARAEAYSELVLISQI